MSLSTASPIRAVAPPPPPDHDPSDADESSTTAFIFGRYQLIPGRRLLLADNQQVDLHSRAFEILLALVKARGALVTREQLSKRVWPNTFVERHNLDTQMSTLRKVLNDRGLIHTDVGRGWRLAVPVRAISVLSAEDPPTNVPYAVSPLIGRAQELDELRSLISKNRLLTLTGPGGIGKTQLAHELARLTLSWFPDGVWVVDLGQLETGTLPTARVLARTLKIRVTRNANATAEVARAVQRKHMLLVIDNCEHLVDEVAPLVETLLRTAPQLHVLTTSQEWLAADGEHVYPVGPLVNPAVDVSRATEAMSYSAVQLFVRHARAADPRFALDDRNVAACLRICRLLDGIPLAIELAAVHTATVGAESFDHRANHALSLLTGGRRTAIRRHQTLTAALDWSYQLLEDTERRLLNRLSVFVGSFTLESAALVVGSDELTVQNTASLLPRLIAKSAIVPITRTSVPRYRLLEPTRIYAFGKLQEAGELTMMSRRHAEHYQHLIERMQAASREVPTDELIDRYGLEVANIRAALNWVFTNRPEAEIGVNLAVASVQLWTVLSVLSENRDLIEGTLGLIDENEARYKEQRTLLRGTLASLREQEG